jgi:hypothetical protein
MKNQIIMSLLIAGTTVSFGQVGIGTDSPDETAILELQSTEKGFLPSRMTTVQRDAITGQAEGLMIYNLDVHCLQYWNATEWIGMCGNTSEPSEGFIVELKCAESIHDGGVHGFLLRGKSYSITDAITVTIPYVGGNGGTYNEVNIASSGITGLTAQAEAGNFQNGDGVIVFTITGVPSEAGYANFNVTIGGQSCSFSRVVGIPDKMFDQYDNDATAGYRHQFIYMPVEGEDGKIWLNNNLGANYANANHASFNPLQQASSADDYHAFGSLFQWGRKPDGHELTVYTNSSSATSVNGTTATLSDNPDHSLFIVSSGNWRTTNDNTLWSSEASENNPCPVGFRVPTFAEMLAYATAAGVTETNSAAESALKLSSSLFRRFYTDGRLIYNDGEINRQHYWSSTVTGTFGRLLRFSPNGIDFYVNPKAGGFEIRCIKN